jgi:hypothetical protein
MREAGQAGSDGFARLRIGRHGMAERDTHASACQLADKVGGHLFGRQGDKGHAATTRRHQLQIIRGRMPDVARRVHAGSFRGQKRTFQMNAENAGISLSERINRCHSGVHFCRAVTDQGRKQGCGAEPAMRRHDPAYRLWRRLIIKQNIAATVDLKVDKAWRQPRTLRQFMHGQIVRKLGAPHNALDPVVNNNDRGIVMGDCAVKDAACGDGVRPGARFGTHRVRVTFCKCRGRSASVPRCAASLTNKA